MSLNPHAREFVPKAFQAESKAFQADQKANPFFIPLAPPLPPCPPLPLPPSPIMHFRYNELQKMYNESQREVASLKTENSALKRDYESLKGTHTTLAQAHANLKESEDSLRMDLEILQNKIVDLENKNNFLYKGITASKNKQILLEQEQLTFMKLRETSIITINQLEANVVKLEEENRALQESAALQHEELESQAVHYNEKIADLQKHLSDCILRFIEKFREVEQARSEAVYNMELAIHQKNMKAEEHRSFLELFQNATASFIEERAQWVQEREMLKLTLNCLSTNYLEKNGEVAYCNELLQNHERRILELQAYKRIIGELYVPPSKPKRPIMNPETDYDSDLESA